MSDQAEIIKILNRYTPHLIRGDERIPLLAAMFEKIERREALTFLLPAFPAKSPSPQKTSGAEVDMGEVLALQNLESLCSDLQAVTGLEVKLMICSDGRVFSDVVGVSDELIDRYNQGVRQIIREFSLHSLDIFTMDDLYPDARPNELREILDAGYSRNVDDVRALVLENENYRKLFNGMHRFLLEDELALNQIDSKNKISKQTKDRTYELMRRSDAWSELLNRHFADALRLSIHPYPVGHEKFGIKLVEGSNKWATPWHNVVLKIGEKFELMHLGEAKKLGAIKAWYREKYAYFEVQEA